MDEQTAGGLDGVMVSFDTLIQGGEAADSATRLWEDALGRRARIESVSAPQHPNFAADSSVARLESWMYGAPLPGKWPGKPPVTILWHSCPEDQGSAAAFIFVHQLVHFQMSN